MQRHPAVSPPRRWVYGALTHRRSDALQFLKKLLGELRGESEQSDDNQKVAQKNDPSAPLDLVTHPVSWP